MEMVLIFTFCLILAGTDAVTTVTGYRGRSVQIKCPYVPKHERNNKYLCRGKCPTWDVIDVPVQSGSPDKDPRFSLYDDTTAKVFTVNITDLRPEDAGTYWCTIDQTGRDKYTEILLLVKTDAPTISAVSYTTHTTSTQSMSPSVHAENTHSTMYNLSDQNTVSLPRISNSPIISAVSVVPLLLLFVLLIIITIQRKKKTRGSETVTQSPRETNEDYENYQNFLPVKGRENVASTKSVYQSLNPANNQSDSVYQNLNLTNNQSDSVYHTVTVTSNH